MDESKIQESIEGHRARNRELRKFIADKGIRLEERRVIDLHFWAFDENSANDLEHALNASGYPVTLKGKVDDSPLWNVESQIEASPLAVMTPFFVECLVRLAADHQAEFDGWGTSI